MHSHNTHNGLFKRKKMSSLRSPEDYISIQVRLDWCCGMAHGLKLTQINGEITYNGITFKGFIPQRTAAYIEQTDLHLPELTVRETMNFAARVQGVGHKAGVCRHVLCSNLEA